MSKLKLAAPLDDKPVKVTFEVSATVHRDLVAYSEVLSSQRQQPVDPTKLIEPMLARFMATDRVFRKALRNRRRDTNAPLTDS